MAISGSTFKYALEREEKLIIPRENLINQTDIDELNSNNDEYVQLNSQTQDEYFTIDIKNEAPDMKNYSLSDLVAIKQKLEACKMPLKKAIDLILWNLLKENMITYGFNSTFWNFIGAATTGGIVSSPHNNDIVEGFFIGFVATTFLSLCVTVSPLFSKLLPQIAYPFPIRKKIEYEPLYTLLTTDQVNEIITTTNTFFPFLKINENNDGGIVLRQLNIAEKYIIERENEIKASEKAVVVEVLNVVKNLNRNGFFAHNSNSETPDPIRKTTLEYIISEESVINSLVPSRKKFSLC